MASAELKSDPCEAPEHSGLPGDSVLGAWRGRGTLTAGLAGAVDGGHPQVGGAGVKDDSEVLSGGADADGPEVLRLPGVGGGGGQDTQLTDWGLPSLASPGTVSGSSWPHPASPFTGLLAFVS